MLRWLFVLASAAALVALDAQSLFAAGPATAWPPGGGTFSRGAGAYLSPWKILATWVLFATWVGTTDWVSRDAQSLKLRHALWNPIVFFSFFVALLLLWLIPLFSVGFVLLLVTFVGPLSAYIVVRDKAVISPYDKIMSAKHARRWVAQKVSKIGIKMEGADVDPRAQGPDVQFSAVGGATERDNNVNLLTARQSPAYLPARELIDDALQQRATHIMLDYTSTSVGLRHQVDGAWHERAPLDRDMGDLQLAVFKGLSALKIEDRRSRQSGTFDIQSGKEKYTCKISSQGTKTGERVLLQIESRKLTFKTVEDLGMRTKMYEQVEAILQQPGLLIFSSLPGGGLTTTLDVVLSTTDRYMRSFVSVADAGKPDRDIENVHLTTFSSASGETPATVLPKLIRTYPDVIVVRDVADLETLAILCEQVSEKRLMITSTRAREAVEALLRVMMLKIPPADFAPAVTAVLNVRLIRKLCEKCKEGYAPPAEVLKQLGLPAGRIEALYRPPTQPIDPKHPEVVCDQCDGIGYFGRTGIFELLTVDDDIRNVLTTAPKVENLRAVARKAKHRSLQDEGILLVGAQRHLVAGTATRPQTIGNRPCSSLSCSC